MRYLSSGESHGPVLTVIIEGLPAGMKINKNLVARDLENRQKGFGRGDRMKIEKDTAEFLSGIRNGRTIGSPLTISIKNRDWENWKNKRTSKKTIPRPGHADLPGLLKYNTDDIQDIIERASARETAAKVAAGSIAKILLGNFGVKLVGHTIGLGGIFVVDIPDDVTRLMKSVERSNLRCADSRASAKMRNRILAAMESGDTVGGVVEVRITGVPAGLGSYAHWDRRLDGRLAQSLMSIPSVKAVEMGDGVSGSSHFGSEIHDSIYYSSKTGYFRKTNRAGGIEGGISNGENILVKAYLKPISTLKRPLDSVNIGNHKAVKAPYVRSDTAVIPAASVVAEAAAAWTIAACFAEKFGGDSITEMLRNYQGYLKQLKRR